MKRKDCFFGLHFDFHANADTTDIGIKFNPHVIEKIIEATHPDYIQCDTKGHPGYSSYPTKVGNPAPHIAKDILNGWRKVTKAKGVLLYAHYSGLWDMAATKSHTEWAAVSDSGKILDRASIFGEYADKLLIPQLSELAEVYRLDGCWVDGECWAQAVDYSEQACAAWHKETGEEPQKKSDADYSDFLDFQRRKFFSYVKHYILQVKKSCPAFEITSNWLNTAWVPDDVNITDYISGDLSPTNSVDSARFDGRVMQSFGRNWDIMSWGISFPVHYVKSAAQLCQEAAVILSLGGGFQIYNMQSPHGTVVDEWAIPIWKEVSAFCRERKEFCKGSTIKPDVGILYSPAAYYDQCDALYNRENPYNLELNGLLLGVCDMGYSVSIIHAQRAMKGEVELSEYETIFVSDATSLENGLKEKLLEYARRGGKLVLCGKNTVEMFAPELDLRLQPAQDPNVVRAVYKGTAFEIRRPYVKIAAKKRKGMYMHECTIKGDITCTNPPPAILPKREKLIAFTWLKEEKGMIGIMPISIGRMYLEENTFELRQFLEGCFLRERLGKLHSDMAGKADVLSVEKGGKQFIHVVNLQGEHRNAQVKTFKEIPPIFGEKITYNCQLCPKEIIERPNGKKIKFSYKNGTLTFKTRKTEIYSIYELVY